MTKSPELFLISMAADLLNMHPQTLRKYERLGLVQPSRTLGSMRVYTRDEVERIRLIKTFVDQAGMNLAGVHRLLSIAEVAHRLHPLLGEQRRGASDHADLHRQLDAEVDRLFELLGLTRPRD